MSGKGYCPHKKDLPESWERPTISEIARINPPGATLEADDDELVSFVPMPSVQELTGKMDTSDHRPFSKVKTGYTRFIEEDVLFAKITPCMENGKIAIARDLMNGKGCGSTEFHVVRNYTGVLPEYVRYFLVQNAYRGEAQRHMSGAVGQLRVPPDYLRESFITLPSTAEQSRIVSKIEELFSDLDKGEENLRRVQALIGRYRQSVLKAAVTGELTRDWREKNKDSIETGEQLLKRILKARREAWEKAELAKMHDKGQKPKNDKWKEKYKEPAGPDTSELSELPEGWVWATVEQLNDGGRAVSYGVLQPGKDVAGGIPLIRVCDINGGAVARKGLKQIDKTIADKYQRTYVSGGEVLLTVVGSIGRSAVVPKELSGANTARAVSVIPVSELYSPDFMEMCFRERGMQIKMIKAAHEVARKTLNLEDVRAACIPVPSTIEAGKIIDEVNIKFADIQQLEQNVLRQINYSATVRQSILKTAFSGQLVPQDPNDEPASELLKRIAEEKAKTEAAKPKRGGPKKKTTLKSKNTHSKLAEARKKAGLTQAKLAKAAGINPAYISQMENGRRAITPEQAEKLAEALGVTAQSLQ